MIIVKKSGYLLFKNHKFKCAFGKNGIKKKIKEGDNITPKGIFKLIKIYYRADRIKNLKTILKKIKIKKNTGWCDDYKSKFYNKEIKLPSKYSYENFYRKDHIYDLIVIINYNTNPVIKRKGSAIFMHIAKKKFTPTQGCLALKKKNLLLILSKMTKKTRLKIG
jgi:L,D-peptidoglycan transpeptidase YkuD (ErfK/YbiS/YcfS/YnhG family)